MRLPTRVSGRDLLSARFCALLLYCNRCVARASNSKVVTYFYRRTPPAVVRGFFTFLLRPPSRSVRSSHGSSYRASHTMISLQPGGAAMLAYSATAEW